MIVQGKTANAMGVFKIRKWFQELEAEQLILGLWEDHGI